MAWTTPKTDFADGNVLTAAQMNAIGNDLAYLKDSGGTLISTTTLSGSSVSITVPSGYKTIRLIVEAFQPAATAYLGYRLNGTSVTGDGIYMDNIATTVGTSTDSYQTLVFRQGFRNTATTATQCVIDFLNYDSTSVTKLAVASGKFSNATPETVIGQSTLSATQGTGAAITAINLNAPTAFNQVTPTTTFTGTAYLIGF